jgi:DNA repair protein RadC
MTVKKAKEYKLAVASSEFEQVKVATSEDAVCFARQFYGDDLEIYESFFLMILNRANTIVAWVKISQGGLTGTVADPVLIAKYALESLAKGVILCHNHPSGNTKPSEADLQLTQKIKQGLGFFDIKVLDHLILTTDSFYSFTDNGII